MTEALVAACSREVVVTDDYEPGVVAVESIVTELAHGRAWTSDAVPLGVTRRTARQLLDKNTPGVG